MHLVGFVTRIYHDARSPEQCQMLADVLRSFHDALMSAPFYQTSANISVDLLVVNCSPDCESPRGVFILALYISVQFIRIIENL